MRTACRKNMCNQKNTNSGQAFLLTTKGFVPQFKADQPLLQYKYIALLIATLLNLSLSLSLMLQLLHTSPKFVRTLGSDLCWPFASGC